ncbi:hypothetical protein [Nonomuraea bangladeshensis]|uniref:hypothetical protein n=1 Tax=Nonomuraea bangladeshensis TaxID=404385 RepID=UPI003C2BB279
MKTVPMMTFVRLAPSIPARLPAPRQRHAQNSDNKIPPCTRRMIGAILTGVLALSIATLLESAATDEHRQTGKIENLEKLLQPEGLAALEKVATFYAFLAFHPGVDQAIKEYVLSGSLSADSGPDVLVMFCLDETADTPTPLDDSSFGSWLTLETTAPPAYTMVRHLFGSSPVPPLPGIAFFEGIGHDDEVVYVHLVDDHEPEAARAKLRKVLSIAAQAASRSPGSGRQAVLAAGLLNERIPYTRSGRTSLREWLIHGRRFLSERGWDLVSLLGL